MAFSPDTSEKQKESLVKIVKEMQPGIPIDANTRFVSAGSNKNRASIQELFDGRLSMGHAGNLGVLPDQFHRGILYRQLVAAVAGCQGIFRIDGGLYHRNRQNTRRDRMPTERLLF